MKKRYLILVLLIIVTVALGFLRDHIFVSINERIAADGGNTELLLLKWLLTFLFSILYFMLTVTFLYIIFHSQKYLWLTAGVYAGLFAVSFFVIAIGFLISSFENVYPFVRTVMELPQSPIVLMILIPACIINEYLCRRQHGA